MDEPPTTPIELAELELAELELAQPVVDVHAAKIVRYRANWTIFALVVIGIALLGFLYAAFDRSFLLALSENRRAGWLSLLTVFEYRGVNWAIIALVAYVMFECRKMVKQVVDPVAVKLVDDELLFHPSINNSARPLHQLTRVSYDAGLLKSDITFQFVDSQKIRIRNVEGTSAKFFAASIRDDKA